jgi:hypothetical protein
MLAFHRRIASKGLRLNMMRDGSRQVWPAGAFAALSLLAVAACSNLPRIGGGPLPPEMSSSRPVYRDLADIPAAPDVTPHATNQMTIDTLTQDRAKTAQAAEDLRQQPFMQPDSDTKPGF